MNRLNNPNYFYSAFIILLVGAIYFVINTSTHLPAQMASHFNAEGIADGFMSKEGYTYTMLALVVLVPGLLAVLPFGMRKLPASLINLPHKEYWLQPEKQEETFLTLSLFMSVLACLLFAFFKLCALAGYPSQQTTNASHVRAEHLGRHGHFLVTDWSLVSASASTVQVDRPHKTLNRLLRQIKKPLFCNSGFFFGGAGRSRTDLHGFAIRCITALLPRRVCDKKGKQLLP